MHKYYLMLELYSFLSLIQIKKPTEFWIENETEDKVIHLKVGLRCPHAAVMWYGTEIQFIMSL